MAQANDSYVYAHRDAFGKVFYVGKGKGLRAWSKNRHPVWHEYLRRNGSQFTVEILASGLTDDEACEREDALIGQFGAQLVNWINPGRDFDYAALEKFHAMRDANRALCSETKVLESTDPASAAERYRSALATMHEYASIITEHGLVAELADFQPQGDLHILDRLTLVLFRIDAHQELVEVVDDFFRRYPQMTEWKSGKDVLKLRDRSLAKIYQES